MSNTKNLANLASVLDDGTSGQVLQSTGSGGVQFSDSSGSGVTVHANQAAMLTDAASADEGTLHYETGTNKLYVKQSSGFYLLASITNASPTIDSFSENTGGAGANNLTAGGTFELTSGSNTVVTINATEPDLETISYSATVTSGTATDVFSSPSFPVSNQSSNVFTLTPVTSGTGGTVTIRFDASDGTNVANVSHSFEIAFVIADSHYTTLLMATDGSAGDNNDITDSSSSNHTITVNDDAHAGTFSPYRSGGYSTYFDGSGDWLELTGTALGNGNFTVEAWVWLDTFKDYNVIYDDRATGSSATGLALGVTSTGAPYLYTNNGFQITSSQTCTVKTWHHISLVRSSGVITIYLDGTSGGTYSSSANFTDTNLGIGVARTYTLTSQFGGYIRDVRAVVGSAITPASGGPTERLTTVSGTGYSTSLLTCHLPYIADGSSNAYAITVNGDPETKPIGPYDYSEYSESTNGGSVYFDGNGDYVSVSDLGLSGDITIEGWFYQSVAQSATYRCALGASTYSTNGEPLRIYTYNSIYSIWLTNTGGPHISGSFTANTWHHVALVRSSGTWTLYIDGTSAGTSTTNGTYNFASTVDWTLGADAATTYPFTGYLSDVRVVEGTAVYSGNFTPPTGPLTTTGGTYPSTTNVDTSITASNTKLLLSGTDAHVIDKSQVSNLKLLGTAASTSALTSGTTPPYIGAAWANTSAVSFDGNSDYVRVPYESIPSFGAGEFTIEGWIYTNNLSASQLIVDKYASGNSQSFQIYYRSTGTSLTFYVGSSILLQDPSSSTISVQTWHHFAVTRDGSNNVRLYVDGLKKAQSTSSVNFDSSIDLHLGVQGSTSTNYFNGYMQDVRLSNKAFYTADDESSNIPSAPLKG
jgi:hypothetical protein